MKELYELCPKFNVCSAPKCPLDSQYHTRIGRFPNEEKCTVRKSVRLRIVTENIGYNTPFRGYTAGEFRWHGSNSPKVKSTESQIAGLETGLAE